MRALLSHRRFQHWLARDQVEEMRARLTPLRPETRRRLVTELARPTRELEDFLGRRLPEWFQ
jgi:hypothetical protein